MFVSLLREGLNIGIHQIMSNICKQFSWQTVLAWYSSNNIKYAWLLTSWRIHLEKLTGSQLVKKFPAFYGTRRFITAFTRARHVSLYVVMLYFHLRPGLPSGLFPSGFSNKTLHAPLLSSIHATCPAHLNLLCLITRTTFDEEYKSLSSSLCSFLCCHFTLSFLGPNILLSTLFSNILSLRSSLIVSDRNSHSCKTRGKIIVMYILILSNSWLNDKIKIYTNYNSAWTKCSKLLSVGFSSRHDLMINSFYISFCCLCPSLSYFPYDKAIMSVLNNT